MSTDQARLLITGASGLLGTTLLRNLKDKYKTLGTYHRKKNPALAQLDITDEAAVAETLNRFNPSYIVHCAALIDVDEADRKRDLAWHINVDATGSLAERCNEIGSHLIYISSDYVFDGEHSPYREDAPPRPGSFYGLTKAKGEEMVASRCESHTILRPAIMYDRGIFENSRTFVNSVYETLKKGERIEVDNYRIKYPLLTDDVATAIDRVIADELTGIVHIAGPDAVTRFEWAQLAAKIFGQDPELIEMSAKPQKDRPRDINLVCTRLSERGFKFTSLQEGLTLFQQRVTNNDC